MYVSLHRQCSMTLIRHALVTKRARRGGSHDDKKETTKRFGPLKAILEAIGVVCANREVRLRPPCQWFSFDKLILREHVFWEARSSTSTRV